MSGGQISGQRSWRRSRRVVLGADPAAGADWSVAVPSGHAWEVVSVYASLVADATVASRAARLQVDDGDGIFLDLAPADVQTAGETNRYAWIATGSGYVTGAGQVIPIPRLVLAPGATIAVSTDNLQAGDNWSAPRLYVIDTTIRGGPVDLAELPDLVVEVVPTPAAG